MGLLDINSLLSSLQPSDADQQDARRMGLLAAGLAMMGARNGHVMQDFGQAGLLGLQSYNQALENKQKLAQQKMQTISSVVPLLQLQQRQDLMGNLNDLLRGAEQPTQVDTTLPQGAVGGGGMGGGTAAAFGPSSQPGPVSGPTTTMPAYQVNPALRQQLAKASIAAKAGLGVDISPDVKLMFPDPIRVNAGGGVFDPLTRQIAMTPKSVDGSLPVQAPDGTWSYQTVGGATQALATPTITKNLADLATTPQIGVLPGGGQGVVGTKLGSTFPGGVGGSYSFLNNIGNQSKTAPSASPSQPTQTELSPEQKQNSSSLGKELASYREAVSASSKAMAQLDELTGSLKYFKPGPTLPMRASVAGYAQEVPGVGRAIADTLVPNSAAALPAIAAMEKIGVGLTAEQSKVFGSREGQQVIGMIKSAMPNAAMVPGAPQVIIDAQKGMHQWIIDKGNAAQQWIANPSNHGSLDGFSNAWDQAHPVSSYVGNLPALEAIARGSTPGRAASGQIGAKAVVRTGTLNGRRVVQYSDGTTAYAQ